MRILLRDLSPLTPYRVQFRAKDDNGNSSEWSRLFDVLTIGDAVAPKTPTGVTNTVSGTAFKFAWNAVTLSADDSPAYDLQGYRIEVSSPTNGSARFYDTTDTKMDFSFENNVAVFGTPQGGVRVAVAAMDSNGNISPFSAQVLATNAAPVAVTGVVGTPQVDSINLKWNANTTDNDLKGYEVHVSTTGVGGTYTKVYSGLGTSYVHPTVLYGTDHFFKVYSADIFNTLSTAATTGALRPNSAFGVDTTAPAVPTGLAAALTTTADTTTSAQVSWTAVTDTDGDLAGYRIGYRPVGAADWQYADVDYTLTSTRIDRLTPYVNYEFRIRSYDFSANYSAWSSTVTTSTAATNTAPAQVTGVIGVAGPSTVTWLWTESADNDVKNGAGMYEIQMATDSGYTQNLQTIKTAATVASFRTDGLSTPGNRYVRVRAVDSLGLAGPYSSAIFITQTDQGATEAYAQSRGMNLVTNGTGGLDSNKNFSTFTFDSADRPFGGGSFKIIGTGPVASFNDELIPVDTAKTYIQTGYVRQGNPLQLGARFYLGVASFDIDGQAVGASETMWLPNTETTLAAPLNNGDTTVTLTSSANWQNGGTFGYDRSFIFWDYTDSKGYTYPAGTYSRNVYGQNASGAWAAGSIAGNVITLRIPWNAGPHAAGTKVSNGTSGSTYKYIAAVNEIIPQTWTKYQGRIGGGIDPTGQNDGTKFSPGTAYVKLLFLANYPTFTSGVTSSTFSVAGLNFTDVDGANLLPSTMGGDVVIANTLAGDRVIANTLDANTLKANSAFLQNLSVKSTFTLGDASTDGVIQDYLYGTSGGTTGFKLAKSGLIIKSGLIEAAALKVHISPNLVPGPYSDFEFPKTFYIDPFWLAGGQSGMQASNAIVEAFTATTSAVSVFKGKQFVSIGMPFNTNAASANFGMSATDYNISVEPGKTYIWSMYMRNAAATAETWNVKFKGDNGAFFQTTPFALGGSEAALVRRTVAVTIPAGVNNILISLDAPGTTNTKALHIDCQQFEEKTGTDNTPSVWKPTGGTTIDGAGITTGLIRSSSTITVNGTAQPAWSINTQGNAQFGDALVRGKLLVGQSGPDADAGQSYISSGNFSAGLAGWKISSSGNAEFSDALIRGTITGSYIYGSTIATDSNTDANRVVLDGLTGFQVWQGAVYNMIENPRMKGSVSTTSQPGYAPLNATFSVITNPLFTASAETPEKLLKVNPSSPTLSQARARYTVAGLTLLPNTSYVLQGKMFFYKSTINSNDPYNPYGVAMQRDHVRIIEGTTLRTIIMDDSFGWGGDSVFPNDYKYNHGWRMAAPIYTEPYKGDSDHEGYGPTFIFKFTTPADWNNQAVTIELPGNAFIRNGTTGAYTVDSGARIAWSNLMLEKAVSGTDYLDGSMSPYATWVGTADNSRTKRSGERKSLIPIEDSEYFNLANVDAINFSHLDPSASMSIYATEKLTLQAYGKTNGVNIDAYQGAMIDFSTDRNRLVMHENGGLDTAQIFQYVDNAANTSRTQLYMSESNASLDATNTVDQASAGFNIDRLNTPQASMYASNAAGTLSNFATLFPDHFDTGGDVMINSESISRGAKSGAAGYAKIVASSGTTVASTTTVDIPGLAVTFTATAGRRYKVSAMLHVQSSVANDRATLFIRETTTNIMAIGTSQLVTAASPYGYSFYAVVAPTAGAHTYKVSFNRLSGTGTLTLIANASQTSSILVEDIGPA